MFWEFYSVISVKELPNRNCFRINSVIILCVMVTVDFEKHPGTRSRAVWTQCLWRVCLSRCPKSWNLKHFPIQEEFSSSFPGTFLQNSCKDPRNSHSLLEFSELRTRYENSASNPEATRTCKTQQNFLQKGRPYGMLALTPHRRYGHDREHRFCRRRFRDF